MNDRVTLYGKIGFEPENLTKKHKNQASWKKVAMVFFDGDIPQYYSWFLNRRYNLILNPPQRQFHVSFINDSYKDLSINGAKSNQQIDIDWNNLKNKWDGKEISVVFDLNVRTDGFYWWLNVPHDERELLHSIRAEVGLGRPFFGLHGTIGRARDGIHEQHSEYIHNLIKINLIK